MTIIERVWGRQGLHREPYLTRIKLTPKTPWGQLMINIFHRGDSDPDCHDHPWDFWRFPFTRYTEARIVSGGEITQIVEPRRWNFVPAEYRHRVLEAHISLVWALPKRRDWFFWVYDNQVEWAPFWYPKEEFMPELRRVFWRDYVFANVVLQEKTCLFGNKDLSGY